MQKIRQKRKVTLGWEKVDVGDDGKIYWQRLPGGGDGRGAQGLTKAQAAWEKQEEVENVAQAQAICHYLQMQP